MFTQPRNCQDCVRAVARSTAAAGAAWLVGVADIAGSLTKPRLACLDPARAARWPGRRRPAERAGPRRRADWDQPPRRRGLCDERERTCVWNPWIDKAAKLPDFGHDQWKAMVCVEVCNVRDAAICLVPGASHTMTATFELQPTTFTVPQRSTTNVAVMV